MSDIKITSLTELTSLATGDIVPVVDVSDTSMAATGTTKRITWTNIVSYLQSIFYYVGGTDVPVTDGGTGSSSASGARTNLGLVIGTDVQAYNANLTTWAGKTAPSGTVVGTSDTQTLTNKRITKRIGSTASTATLSINTDDYDGYIVTAQTEAITVSSPTGTPTVGQTLLLRFKDNGTGRAISWGASFRVIGTTLPTTTVANKTTYVGCVYNTTDSKWDVILSLQEV